MAANKPQEIDPFDPESLMLPDELIGDGAAEDVLTNMRCGKPLQDKFVRVHPGEEYCLRTFAIEIGGELYLVAPTLWEKLSDEPTMRPYAFFLAVTSDHVLFFWPVKVSKPGARANTWNTSHMEAVGVAKETWVRTYTDDDAKAYLTRQATRPEDLGDPRWPDKAMNELLKIAFSDRFIDSLDHPVLKALRGEV